MGSTVVDPRGGETHRDRRLSCSRPFTGEVQVVNSALVIEGLTSVPALRAGTRTDLRAPSESDLSLALSVWVCWVIFCCYCV